MTTKLLLLLAVSAFAACGGDDRAPADTVAASVAAANPQVAPPLPPAPPAEDTAALVSPCGRASYHAIMNMGGAPRCL